MRSQMGFSSNIKEKKYKNALLSTANLNFADFFARQLLT